VFHTDRTLAWIAVTSLIASGVILALFAAPGPERDLPPESTPAIASSLVSLAAEKGPSAYGRFVFLNDVRLSSGSKKNQYFARGAHGRQVLVIAETKPLAVGDDVVADVTGILRPLPSMKVLQKEWGISARQASHLKGQHTYVAARRVRINEIYAAESSRP